MRILHVAALPFPSPQGTQALLKAWLSRAAELGDEPHLLCYAHGSTSGSLPFEVHRLADWPRVRSLRSGPSLGKLALDARLVSHARRLVRTLAPDLVVAHHAEAAAALALAHIRPYAFVAHTSLAGELPTYTSPTLAATARFAGFSLDRTLCRHADAVLAVSPLLAAELEHASGRDVGVLAPSWPSPLEIRPEEGPSARRKLGLSPSDRVVLYAGNLDAYQGLDVLVRALEPLARADVSLRWLVATESPATQLDALLGQSVLASRVILAPLGSERARREAYAASDVAVVPRGVPGGLPVKLLDALSRGVPVVATDRAAAGFSFGPGLRTVADGDARALAHAVFELLESAEKRSELAALGPTLAARVCANDAAVHTLRALAQCFSERGFSVADRGRW